MFKFIICLGVVLLLVSQKHTFSAERVLDKKMHHLRIGNVPEWSDIQGIPVRQLTVEFDAKINETEQTLSFRQEDVRQNWIVQLNGKDLGKLNIDENAITGYFPVPVHSLKPGKNVLIFNQTDTIVDDIRVGEISLFDLPLQKLLTKAEVSISVVDRNSNLLLPARITIVNSGHALQPVAPVSSKYLAVRAGCVYTGDGKATFTLPDGKYTIFASRGFEYGVDSFSVVLKPGESIERKLTISREVPTEGWISADTHFHVYAASHGDATVRERVLTIAGEGIELPVLTEHNVIIDIDSFAIAMKVRSYFTPVLGYEYSTQVGHFNVFPLKKETKVPDYQEKDWNAVIKNLDTSVKGKAIILNHARDTHNDFRPFDPCRHVSVAGMEIDGWMLPANSMEVLNSSSQQKDYMQLFNDWFGMVNGGHNLTPVGGSDSHDVSRYVIGQGRTYIKCVDAVPGKIDVHKTTENFLAGKVNVSFGLLTEIIVNKIYGPGDLAPASSEIKVSVRVLGPGWSNVNHIALYANGQKIREAGIQDNGMAGVKWSGSWTIPVLQQDVFLVAIAEGPGRFCPFWQIPKPYQRTSPEWNPKMVGSSGAVWIDGDGDGKKTCAYDYANNLITGSQGDISKILNGLSVYDEAVAVQSAALLQKKGIPLDSSELTGKLKLASPEVQKGFRVFSNAWRESEALLRKE